MRKFLMVVLIVGLAACDNSSKVEVEVDSAAKKLDTAWKKIENSEIIDSVRSKGGKLLDSVRSKGGKLIDKAEKKVNDFNNKDSTK